MTEQQAHSYVVIQSLVKGKAVPVTGGVRGQGSNMFLKFSS
jgi:hypothetical protein